MYYAPQVGSSTGQQVVVNPTVPFAQYGVPSTLPPGGSVFNQRYVGQAGPAFVHQGASQSAKLQQYVEQAVRSAYYQGVAHAYGNFSSATQLSGGGGLGVVRFCSSICIVVMRCAVVLLVEMSSLSAEKALPRTDADVTTRPHIRLCCGRATPTADSSTCGKVPQSGPKRR